MRRRPDDFEANLGYGTCIVRIGETDNGTLRDALNSLNAAVTLAQTGEQKARAYYARSQYYRRLGRAAEEAADLNAFLALSAAPADLVPTAQARSTALGPQPTLTPIAGSPAAPLPATATPGRSGTPAAAPPSPAATP